jgi:iron complex transport system ATP-binding protein
MRTSTGQSTIGFRTQQLAVGIGSRCFCQGLTVDFCEHRVWGVLGANGSGKTTLLHTLAGLRPALQGQLWLNDRPLADWDQRARATRIGVLLQEQTPAFPAQVRELALQGRFAHQSLLQWGTAADLELVEQALARVGLSELAERDQQQLSGGERQRLKIATLLVQQPQLWLLDEPTNHLDLHHQIELLEHLGDWVRSQQQLMVMSLHDLNLARRFCDAVILLHRDGSVSFGPVEQLFNETELSRLYGHPIRCLETAEGPVFLPQ